MLSRTEAIVLRSLKYRDTSGIVNLLTQDHGRQDCIIKGLYGKSAQKKHSLYMVGMQLEVVIYQKPGRDLQHVSEGSILRPHYHILSNPAAQMYLQLMAEILLKAVPEADEAVPELYALCSETLTHLNDPEGGLFAVFWAFLVELAAVQGVLPHIAGAYSPQAQYLLVHELGELQVCQQPQPVDTQIAQSIHIPSPQRWHSRIPKQYRKEMLQEWLRYLSYHLHADFTKLNSLRIFEELFDS